MSDEQLSLIPKAKKRVKGPVPISVDLPIARVVIDSPLPHLDREFDYLVPASLDSDAQAGVRVRVRFAGKLIDGWIMGRATASEHEGTLATLAKVVSPEQVLTPEILDLAQTVATRTAGNLSDVLRSAIPNRHAGAEETVFPEPAGVPDVALGLWSDYVAGPAFFARTLDGSTPRAVVTTGCDDPAEMLARYALTVAHSGKSILILVPDRTAINRVVNACYALGAPQTSVTTIAADDGPQTRYRHWLAAFRGVAKIVVGTRSAIFTPVQELSAICVWDDWNDTLSDPQAPYWHARDVAVARSMQQHTALMFIGPTMSTYAQALHPWMAHVSRSREQLRTLTPRVRSALDESAVSASSPDRGARIPTLVHQVIKSAVTKGPVLVLVARTGYSPRLVCDACRESAMCKECQGPLVSTSRSSAPTCTLCGAIDTNWSCAECHKSVIRAAAIGSQRTAEELGRAFPGIPVRSSSANHIVRAIDDRPCIVVATAGATPTTPYGYAATILLDGNSMLARPDLHATEETFAKWMECVSLVRPDGEVVVVAQSEHPAVQALIRHDPAGFAQRELQSREQVQLPPAVRLVALTGSMDDINDLLAVAELPEGVLKRGPVPVSDGEVRILLSASRPESANLITAIRNATMARSARHKGKPVNVKVDSISL